MKTQSILNYGERYETIGLKNNPFTPKPLDEEQLSLFVGREKQIERATTAIAKKKNIIISGWKGMGKTSALNYLKAKVQKENIMTTALIGTSDERPFFLNMLSGIFRENQITTDDKIIDIMKKNLREYWRSPAAYPTDLIINDILEIVENYRTVNFPLVVLVDEIQKLALPKAKHNLQTTLCDFMFKPNFIFVCAGMTSFFKMMDEPDAALADRFTPEGDIILTPFKYEETQTLIQKRLQSARITQPKQSNTKILTNNFSDENIKLIHKYSQGNPRHIVNLCEMLIDHQIDKTPQKTEKKTIQKCAERLNLLFSQRTLGQLSEETQEIFRAIADFGSGSPTTLSKALGRPATTIQYHLNILKQAGLILAKGRAPVTKYYISKETIE